MSNMHLISSSTRFVAIASLIGGSALAGCSSAGSSENTSSADQAISSDSYEASASSTQASHIDAMLFSSISSSDPGAAASAGAATTTASTTPSLEWWPLSCVTRTKDATNPDVVHVQLQDCTGPFGLVHWTGAITVTYSTNAAGGLHAEATSSDMTVNGNPVTYARSADITISGDDRLINGESAWTRVDAAGDTVSHTRSDTIDLDVATGCRTINGNETTMVGPREVDSTLDNYKICATATGEGCPTGTLTQVHRTSGRTVSVAFNGTDEAAITFPDGLVLEVPLVCGS